MPNKGDSGTIYKPPFLKYRYDDDDDYRTSLQPQNQMAHAHMRASKHAACTNEHTQSIFLHPSLSRTRILSAAFLTRFFSYVSFYMSLYVVLICVLICVRILSAAHAKTRARIHSYISETSAKTRTHARTHVRARTHTNSYIPETPALLEGSILKNLKLGVDDTAIIPQSLF